MEENSDKFTQLRAKHPRLSYRSYQARWRGDDLELNWRFELATNSHYQPDLKGSPAPRQATNWTNQPKVSDKSPIIFRPKTVLRLPTKLSKQIDRPAVQPVVDWLAFNIGMVELLSYWKAAASPLIIIEAAALQEQQLEWWHQLLLAGLGEYFYQNQIEFTRPDLVKFQLKHNIQLGKIPLTDQPVLTSHPSLLVPLGGGKDSIVTIQLLKKSQAAGRLDQVLAFAVNPSPAIRQVATTARLDLITVDRQLDPQLLELNRQGYLNGHTPFSAMIAFVSVLTAYLLNLNYVAISNESSYNQGNVQYLGSEINHQYSKSFRFEQDFRQFLSYYWPVAPNQPPGSASAHPQYFSLLRPLYELQISQLFAQLAPEYFSIFKSCNRKQKANSWCCHCPKCLFTYLSLLPQLGETAMIKVFGQNLLDNPTLLDVSLQLVGLKQTKPFECVGTHQESIIAFYLAKKWYLDQQKPLPILLQLIDQQLPATQPNLATRAATLLAAWNKNHFIPVGLEPRLKR